MVCIALNVDGGNRSRRTEIFTFAAADAPVFVNGRDTGGTWIVRILGDITDRPCRTVRTAAAAGLTFLIDTEGVIYYGVTDTYGRLLFRSYCSDGARRADL